MTIKNSKLQRLSTFTILFTDSIYIYLNNIYSVKRKYLLPLFLLLQLLLLNSLSYFSFYVENFYSNGLYKAISGLLRLLFGWIPFSVGDLIYLATILFIIKWIWKKRGSWKKNWKKNILQVLSFLSVFYFLFYSLWAINYYRQPLFEKMKIEREYSDEDLLLFTKKLIERTNNIHRQLTNSDTTAVKYPYSYEETFKMNLNGYDHLAKELSFFKFSKLSIKKSLFSLPLTYMGFGGYLNPFTNEAQVNYLMPMYNFPTTSCHEMAHQMGYASESECNFIGFLASVKNENLYFKYSAYSFALRYCLGNWSFRNEETFKELMKEIHPGILKNYKESEDFWIQYETPIERGFHIFYDNYLKYNQQTDGMASYSKFINLMVNYYKTREL